LKVNNLEYIIISIIFWIVCFVIASFILKPAKKIEPKKKERISLAYNPFFPIALFHFTTSRFWKVIILTLIIGMILNLILF